MKIIARVRTQEMFSIDYEYVWLLNTDTNELRSIRKTYSKGQNVGEDYSPEPTRIKCVTFLDLLGKYNRKHQLIDIKEVGVD